MVHLSPPPPERPSLVAVGDDDRLKRVHFRLFQIFCAAITVLLTAWFVTLGPISAVLSLLIAKHVLVAILLMGMGVDKPRK
jgi:hypothetical protein